MKRILIIIGLELYALLLAFMQSLGGVRTDEAKYLMDIPYPHPPAIRWFLSLFDALPMQEIIIRIVFASLMVHAVWLVWDMAKQMKHEQRLALAALWLLSGGVILQAGTVMIAPITALQVLVLLWMDAKKSPLPLIGIWWLFSLFSAYQAVLFLPIVLMMVWQRKKSTADSMLYCAIPVGLLCLYTVTNPLIPASMVIHSGRDLYSSLGDRLIATLRLWAIGGSIILSAMGTVGMIRTRSWGLIGSFILVCAYIAFSRYDYYAVLFLSLFIGGIVAFPSGMRLNRLSAVAFAVIGFALVGNLSGVLTRSDARKVRPFLSRIAEDQTVLISGSFGHQWQYESPVSVRRYHEDLVATAGAVVCLSPCEGFDSSGFVKIDGVGVEVWVRDSSYKL
ncbi:MAG: hypothetical protein O2904_01545 [bacterium]|nr:hypothetical protein [bacterium]